jgi:hypothetical protein
MQPRCVVPKYRGISHADPTFREALFKTLVVRVGSLKALDLKRSIREADMMMLNTNLRLRKLRRFSIGNAHSLGSAAKDHFHADPVTFANSVVNCLKSHIFHQSIKP